VDDVVHPISRVVDTEGEFLTHGVVTFENALGGRVACFPYDMQGESVDNFLKGPSRFFYTSYRRMQIHALMEWLGCGPAPMVVHTTTCTLPHRADGDGRAALAVMNVNPDPWKGVRITCALDAAPKRVEWLDIDGARAELPASAWNWADGKMDLTLDTTVPMHRTVAVVMEG
jgi:hypothetical protein